MKKMRLGSWQTGSDLWPVVITGIVLLNGLHLFAACRRVQEAGGNYLTDEPKVLHQIFYQTHDLWPLSQSDAAERPGPAGTCWSLTYHQGTCFSVTPLGGNSGGQQLFLMEDLHLETFRRRTKCPSVISKDEIFVTVGLRCRDRFGLIIAHNLMKINRNVR